MGGRGGNRLWPHFSVEFFVKTKIFCQMVSFPLMYPPDLLGPDPVSFG